VDLDKVLSKLPLIAIIVASISAERLGPRGLACAVQTLAGIAQA